MISRDTTDDATPRGLLAVPGPAGRYGAASLRLRAALAGALVALLVTAAIVPVLDAERRAAEQAEMAAYGSTLASQLAGLAVEASLAEDRIAQSALLARAVASPAVLHASIVDRDDQMVAHSGPLPERDTPLYSAEIRLDEQVVGTLHVTMDPAHFHHPLASPGLVAAVLAAMAAAAAALWWVVAPIERLMRELQQTLARIVGAPVAADRSVLVAARLALDAARLDDDDGPPRPAPDRIDPAAPSHPPWLVFVNLFQLGSMPPHERNPLLEACADAVEDACELYQGRVERIAGTGVIAILEDIPGDDCDFHALCTALVIRRVLAASELPVARIGVHAVLPAPLDPTATDEAGGPADDAAAVSSASPASTPAPPPVAPLRERQPEAWRIGMALSGMAPDGGIVLSPDASRRALARVGHRIVTRVIAAPALRFVAPDIGAEVLLLEDVAGTARDLLDRQAARIVDPPA